MNKGRNPQSKIKDEELEEIENKGKDKKMRAKLEKQQAAYKQMVTNMKVPLWKKLRIEKKDEESIRVLGLNIDSLSFWQKVNHKAERLKLIFERYGVNTAGLQDVCIN